MLLKSVEAYRQIHWYATEKRAQEAKNEFNRCFGKPGHFVSATSEV